jgi:hypothetical protein
LLCETLTSVFYVQRRQHNSFHTEDRHRITLVLKIVLPVHVCYAKLLLTYSMFKEDRVTCSMLITAIALRWFKNHADGRRLICETNCY